VSQALTDQFSQMALNGGSRILKVIIENEKTLVPVLSVNGTDNWEKDFDLTKTLLDAKIPCYLLFRTDEKKSARSIPVLHFEART